jgi:hypothetical protein
MVRFRALPEKEFAERARELAPGVRRQPPSTNQLNPLVAQAFSGEAPASMKEVSERYGKLLAGIDKKWEETLKAHATNSPPDGQQKSSPPTSLSDTNEEALRLVLYAADSPANVSSADIPRLFDVPAAQKNRALKRKAGGAGRDASRRATARDGPAGQSDADQSPRLCPRQSRAITERKHRDSFWAL